MITDRHIVDAGRAIVGGNAIFVTIGTDDLALTIDDFEAGPANRITSLVLTVNNYSADRSRFFCGLFGGFLCRRLGYLLSLNEVFGSLFRDFLGLNRFFRSGHRSRGDGVNHIAFGHGYRRIRRLFIAFRYAGFNHDVIANRHIFNTGRAIVRGEPIFIASLADDLTIAVNYFETGSADRVTLLVLAINNDASRCRDVRWFLGRNFRNRFRLYKIFGGLFSHLISSFFRLDETATCFFSDVVADLFRLDWFVRWKGCALDWLIGDIVR